MVEILFQWAEGADASFGLPAYETMGAAGADLRANIPADITIQPTERALIPTGLHMAMPRSGLALKQGITALNAPGTIDSDYRGPVGVILINHGIDPVTIKHGDRIAQMVAAPVIQATFKMVDNLDTTERGAAGFGSTGVR
ncbi:MAG: dUTP diphosphatase [Planktomarina sp.]